VTWQVLQSLVKHHASLIKPDQQDGLKTLCVLAYSLSGVRFRGSSSSRDAALTVFSLLKILGNLLKHPSLKLGLSVMELWEQIFKHHADNILKASPSSTSFCRFCTHVALCPPVPLRRRSTAKIWSRSCSNSPSSNS
jgi:hypothetical protein